MRAKASRAVQMADGGNTKRHLHLCSRKLGYKAAKPRDRRCILTMISVAKCLLP
jgi:hypothetical protein